MSLAIVVPVYNEEKNIVKLLIDWDKAINKYYNKKYKFIIINDGSTDNTYPIACGFAADNPVLKVLKLERRGASGTKAGKHMALDWGIKTCQGKIILSTDADCIVPNTWLERMVEAYERKVGVIVGFSMLDEKYQEAEGYSISHSRAKNSLHRLGSFLFLKLQSLELLSLFFVSAGALKIGMPLSCTGSNIGYRRQVYDELGGFVNLGSTVSKDSMFIQWVDRKTKWEIKVICHPDATSLTRPTKTLRDFLRQRTRWSASFIKMRLPWICFFIAAYGFYLSLPITLLLAAFGILPWLPTFIIIAFKLIPDFLLVLIGLKFFNRMDLLKYFPLLEPCQIVYSLICSTCGTLFKTEWKGKKYPPELMTF